MKLSEDENFIQNKYGYCYYALKPYPEVYNLYVHKEYRRKGHSKKLLKYAISEIRETGYEGEIKIDAKPREDSIDIEILKRYYKDLGFTLYY